MAWAFVSLLKVPGFHSANVPSDHLKENKGLSLKRRDDRLESSEANLNVWLNQ